MSPQKASRPELPAAGPNSRRAPRVPHRLDVVLKFPQQDQRYQTRDISYIGVFIECPDPLPLRTLIRFQTRLDEEHAAPLELIGVVAHRINAADAVETGRPTGMGLQLFGTGKETRETWRAFVHAEYEKNPEAIEQVRVQQMPKLKLRFPNLEEMRAFASEHVARGEVFIRSAELYGEGEAIKVEAIHPLSERSELLDARVEEAVEAPRNNRGMRLSFPDAQASSQTLMALAERAS